MQATRFERAAALVAGVSLAATIVAVAIGEARAQPVTPPITLPPPTFNPSSPNTVPQAPYQPVAPSTPGNGLSGSAPASVAPVTPDVVTPPSSSPQTANAPAAKSAGSRVHVRHHGTVRAHWSRHYGRYHVRRPLGPSYYPELGLIYPPYANPCHFRQIWSGYYAGHWEYRCWW